MRTDQGPPIRRCFYSRVMSGEPDSTSATDVHSNVIPFPARGSATAERAAPPVRSAPPDQAAPAPMPSGPVPPPSADPLWRVVAGEILRNERTELGRTLGQVAERAGISPQYLSEVERGRKEPSSEMLESICGALGLRLADLLIAGGRRLTLGGSQQLIGGGRSSTSRPSGPTAMARLVG
jgi:nucleotide-binding universal stress UspA family protein